VPAFEAQSRLIPTSNFQFDRRLSRARFDHQSRASLNGNLMFTLDSIMERHPLLSADGFDAKDPIDLRSRADQIDAALAYLRAGAPLDSAPSAGMYSHGMKHRAEEWAGLYISNGAMIAAALMLGWKVKRDAISGSNATVWPPQGYRKRLPELAEAAK
jgi:hypothetical protein